MKNSKLYIIGGGLLLLGLAIGWFIKPSPEAVDHSDHVNMEMPTGGVAVNEEVWTCSMHPQVRQDGPGLCPICEMDLIPLNNSSFSDDPTVLRMSEEAAKLAQVETFIVGRPIKDGSNQAFIKVDGTIELDERTVKSQTAHVPGRIEAMEVTFEGQYIKKGQKIATIYSTEVFSASQELLTANQFNERIAGLKDAAMQKLKNWKVTDEQIQGILTSNQPIETIDLYADHSGYVLSKKQSLGDYVKVGQPLYTIGSTSKLWLIFNAFESDLAYIKKGNKVTFTTPSVPNRSFTSSITYIDPLLNSSSRTATIRAEISNSSNLLKPGMLISGLISASKSGDVKKNASNVKVPSSAVLWTGNRSVVYVKLPNSDVPSFEFREVEVGEQSGSYVNIITGISDGDEVVTQGAFAVDAAAQLSNNFSMMNRNVKIKESESTGTVASFIEDTPEAFKQQLDETIISYIKLKNTFVESSAELASSAAESLLESVAKIDMTLLSGDAHNAWMQSYNAIKGHATKIKEGVNLEEQREQFSFLSQAIINSVKAFGTNGSTYYVQHCPMAKDDQGADWISTEKQIRNPYFGDKMMKCGYVTLELNHNGVDIY
jgi:Cu(I)/Ag(I) efflux system membrane fusion protein